LDRSR